MPTKDDLRTIGLIVRQQTRELADAILPILDTAQTWVLTGADDALPADTEIAAAVTAYDAVAKPELSLIEPLRRVKEIEDGTTELLPYLSLDARLDALETAPVVDVSDILARLDALETAPVVDVSDILARLDALETATPESGLPSGAIMVWPVASAIPSDFLAMDGAEYAEIVSPALAALFGASSPGNFRVPDWRDRAVVGASVSHTIGTFFGESIHTLTSEEMPKHSHEISTTWPTNTGKPYIYYCPPPSDGYQRLLLTNNAGGGQPHNNLPPSVAAIWIIKK